jgi:hypothetical protein
MSGDMVYFKPEYCWVFAVGCMVFFAIHAYLLFSENVFTHVFMFLALIFAGMFGGCKGASMKLKYESRK